MFKAPYSQSLAIATIAAVGFAATPVLARDSSHASKTRMTIEQKNGETVYCAVESAQIGSNISKKVCQTRSQWADEGLVIPEQQRAANGQKEQPAG